MNQEISFYETVNKGKNGEEIFEEDFLKPLKIKYQNVTKCQQFQIIDTDFGSIAGRYEIKLSYNDDNFICIEDWSNYNLDFGEQKLGWWYTTEADVVIFISKVTRMMILLPINEIAKRHYENIKEKYELIKNRVSFAKNYKWQSAFRKVSLEDFGGHYLIYQKK